MCQLVKINGYKHTKQSGHAIRALTPDEKLRLVDEYDAEARAAMAVGAELSEQGAANTSVEQAGADAVAPPLDLTAVHTDPQGRVCHLTHLELASI